MHCIHAWPWTISITCIRASLHGLVSLWVSRSLEKQPLRALITLINCFRSLQGNRLLNTRIRMNRFFFLSLLVFVMDCVKIRWRLSHALKRLKTIQLSFKVEEHLKTQHVKQDVPAWVRHHVHAENEHVEDTQAIGRSRTLKKNWRLEDQ
jgi:hypothetical protein